MEDLKEEKEKKSLVKQDGNFLEYPTCILQRTKAIKEYIINAQQGTYRIATANRNLPNRMDKVIFYYVLKKLFDSGFKTREIITNRYRLVKDIFDSGSKLYYQRLMDGLKRLTDVSVEFDGIFYEGDNHTVRYFGLLDDAIFDKKTKRVTVRVNEQIIEQIKNSKYFRLIDWKKFKKFRSDVSARLYEIFQVHEFPWKIGSVKLAEKLTVIERYPSDIAKKVEPAVNEINRKTNLKVEFTHYKNDEGETIFEFNLHKRIVQGHFKFSKLEEKTDKGPKRHETEVKIDLAQFPLFSNLNSQFLQSACNKFGIDKVEKILDVLQLQYKKSNQPIKNSEALVYSALSNKDFLIPEDYVPRAEREERKKKSRAEAEAERKALEKQEREEKELEQKINRVISSLPKEKLESLRTHAEKAARNDLGEEAFKSLSKIFIDIKLKQIIKEEYL